MLLVTGHHLTTMPRAFPDSRDCNHFVNLCPRSVPLCTPVTSMLRTRRCVGDACLPNCTRLKTTCCHSSPGHIMQQGAPRAFTATQSQVPPPHVTRTQCGPRLCMAYPSLTAPKASPAAVVGTIITLPSAGSALGLPWKPNWKASA